MDHSPGFLAIAHDARSRVVEVSVHDVQGLLRGQHARVIDVREDHEWDAGHVAGATHLSKGVIERDIERLEPNRAAPIVLYCGGGFRSALAADALQKMGYTNVQSLAGGWGEWTRQGGDVEVPPS